MLTELGNNFNFRLRVRTTVSSDMYIADQIAVVCQHRIFLCRTLLDSVYHRGQLPQALLSLYDLGEHLGRQLIQKVHGIHFGVSYFAIFARMDSSGVVVVNFILPFSPT